MNYLQTLDYLYRKLPMYQRIGKAAYKFDLKNTIAICKLLDDPQNKFISIHIAGTNGKGSVAHMLSSVLQSCGLNTGLYTSPHFKDFRERIKINGRMITRDKVCEFVEKYKDGFEKIKPSFFEMTVALAFYHFAGQKVDIAVIETGLGGRLDSTNVITPGLSVITNIGIDHTEFLGNTLEEIAVEKAGIIKQGVPVVIGETQEEIKHVFIDKAREKSAEIYFADNPSPPTRAEAVLAGEGPALPDLASLEATRRRRGEGDPPLMPTTATPFKKSSEKYRSGRTNNNHFQTDLLGQYQKKNIITALKCVDVLRQNGIIISQMYVEEGLKNVVKNTGLLGRWQILSSSPLTICDAAHNAAGVREAMAQVRSTPHKKLHFVFGMVKDKDIDPVLELLPADALYYFCKADIPRGLDQNQLAEKAKKYRLSGNVYTSVKDALMNAGSNAGKDDLVFVGGSSFVVAEVV
ncbi:MAG: folylpolyglutamate synthase/dihydrofolate synthase family protein [Bacteroidota bacterium]